MLLQLCIKVKSHVIYNQLIFPLKTPYEFVIKQFDSIRNPNTDKEIVPKYLRDGLKRAWVGKKKNCKQSRSIVLDEFKQVLGKLFLLKLIDEITALYAIFTNDMANHIFQQLFEST